MFVGTSLPIEKRRTPSARDAMKSARSSWDAYYDFMQSRVVDAYEVADRIREAGR